MAAIFLTNLGKYNEGYLQGEWLDLPCTDEKLEETKRELYKREDRCLQEYENVQVSIQKKMDRQSSTEY